MEKPPVREGRGAFLFLRGERLAKTGYIDAFAGSVFQDSASSRLRTPLVTPPRRP